MSGGHGKDETLQLVGEEDAMGRSGPGNGLTSAEMLHRERERGMQKDSSQPFYQTVYFAVSFYMVTSIVMVMANKSVLNSIDAPITFLWLQIVVAVILIYLSQALGLWKVPKSLDPKVCYGLIPLVSINVVGLTLNTLCLTLVDASLYQVARSLILPLTVGFSWVLLKKPSSAAVMGACAVVVAGFLVGTLLENKQLKISFWGITFGVLSSITTALHSVVISRSLEVVNQSLMDLVYYNNVLSAVGLLPIVVLSGELAYLEDTLYESEGAMNTFLMGTLTCGLFGFALNAAGFLQVIGCFVLWWKPLTWLFLAQITFPARVVHLQIKVCHLFFVPFKADSFSYLQVTSPITHMISSAIRGVLQTVIAVALFGDVVTTQRILGIALILAGSSYYTWVRSIESELEKGSKV